MRSATLLTVLLAAIAAGFAQPSVPLHYTSANVRGTLLRYTTFPSQFITPREVDIWLPESYVADSNTSYPVIYMQDGQNLFDPALNDFNHTEWQVDESITRLVAEKKIQPAIVVGIWNTREKRRQEYMPAKAAALAARSGRIPIVRNDTIDVAEITSDLLPALPRRGAEAICGRQLPHPPAARLHLPDGLQHGRAHLGLRHQ